METAPQRKHIELIRRHFSKGTRLTDISEAQAQVRRIMNKLNNRPRKCLGMKLQIKSSLRIIHQLYLKIVESTSIYSLNFS